MKKFILAIIILGACASFSFAIQKTTPAAKASPLMGRFVSSETDVKNGAKSIQLDISGTPESANIIIVTRMTKPNTTISATPVPQEEVPTAYGPGKVENGVLNFTFTDNLKNEGTGTLKKQGKEYVLETTLTKIATPESFAYYAQKSLKRIKADINMEFRR